MRRTTWLRALAATALVAAPFTLPEHASAGSAHGTGIGLPSTAAVGQMVDATIVITNASTPPENASTHTITDILVVPSCGASGPDAVGDCPTPEVGTITVEGAGTGVAGTACAGMTFTVGAEPGSTTGRQRLTPSTPVVLAAPSSGTDDECHIDLQLRINGMSSTDVFAAPGSQTVVMVSSVGTSNLSPTPGGNTTSFASGAQPITIVPAATGIATSVVASEVVLGEPVADVATVSGGVEPTGTVTFDLYGPDDTDCSGTPIASSTHPLAAGGPTTSSATTPTEPGEYRFVARYSGDGSNEPAAGACGDPGESVVVAAAEPPGIRVLKTATPLSRPEPGGTFSFGIAVTNTSAVPLTLTGISDDVYGDIALQGTCTDAIGTTLGPGDSYDCAFPGELTGNAGATQTDVVTVTAVDGDGAAVTDTDDAVVALTDVPPTVSVTKTALPEVRAAPGGQFTFQVGITNTSFEPVTITSIVDDVTGDLSGQTSTTCSALVGTTLAPGEQVTCTFEGHLTGEVGAAQTDVVTVVVADDDGSTGSASDDVTVRLVAPGQEPTTSTTSPTVAPPTTRPSTGTTSPGRPRLVATGAGSARSGLVAATLIGVGLLFSGLSTVTGGRRRRGSS